MSDYLIDLGYLSSGSQLRRVYEKLQSAGDNVYLKAGLDFRSSWFPIYHVLAQTNRALTVMEITNRISFSHITVNNVVKELNQKELVTVNTNPMDKRSKLIALSAGGRKLLFELEPLWSIFSNELRHIIETSHIDFMKFLNQIDRTLAENPLDRKVLQKYFDYSARTASQEEFHEIGRLMANVYSDLRGFPSEEEQPTYYKMLRNVGELTKNENVEILVAASERQKKIGGAVVFFSDMKNYGSGGSATREKGACGFRLLAVDKECRGQGLGKLLTTACIEKGRSEKAEQIIIHTTKAMKIAWKMYESMGFERSEDLDFMQGNLPVFGFRLAL